MRGSGWVRACGQRGKGTGIPSVGIFASTLCTLFISTLYEIERKGQIVKGRKKKRKERKCERERKRASYFIAVLAYCRGSANVLFRPFLSSLHATRTAVQLHGVYRTHTPSTAGSVSSPHAANFARFHATTSHDTTVVNFQLTDDSRSVSEYRREFTPFSRGPATCVRRLDVVENHILYRTFLLSFFCLHSRKMRDLTTSFFTNVKRIILYNSMWCIQRIKITN